MDERPIVFAHRLPLCPDCGEPYCFLHEAHYSDCSCLGPSNAEDEGYELFEKNGELWGRKRQ